MNVRSPHTVLVVAATAILFFGAGWFSRDMLRAPDRMGQVRRIALPGYTYTSPLLDLELPEGVVINQEPIPFKYKIASFVRKAIGAGQASDISVYYRDLHDGPWFGINEDRVFNPASMMKVAVMVAWLKRAEGDRSVLNRPLMFDERNMAVPPQHIKPDQTIVSGRTYSVEELLHYMMNYSDNRATHLLYYDLTSNEINAVLDGMDVNNQPDDTENRLTVHSYSGFFRILYNASFLSREMSERALSLLILHDFPDGINAGVPTGVPVASKYGEATEDHPGGPVQLHEFGIVYHPLHPYILGVMTRGRDLGKQKKIIADISRTVYTEVDSHRGPVNRR